MKKLIITLFMFCSINTFATNGIKRLMVLKACYVSGLKAVPSAAPKFVPLEIPKIETPKGAVFCRLEDKLTKATKVWIKIGVK